MTLRKKQEKKRLSNLKREADEHPSVNTAKRYKLPEAAVDIISKAGVIHGQQSRAIQIGAELLLRMKEGVSDDDMRTILDSPLIGKTYKLPERTIDIIQTIAPFIGTRGRTLAAIAYLLSQPDPLTEMQTEMQKHVAQQPNETKQAKKKRHAWFSAFARKTFGPPAD